MAFVTLAWVLQLSGLALVTVAGGLGFSDIALAAEHKQRSMQRHTSLVEGGEEKERATPKWEQHKGLLDRKQKVLAGCYKRRDSCYL